MLSSKYYTILLVLAVALAAFIPPFVVYGQQDGGMKDSLPKAKLDILLEPTWGEDRHANFTVSFLRGGTDVPQQHIDYGFVIDRPGDLADNSAPSCRAVLHTAEGIVTIPCQFQENGDYLVEVSVYSVLFSPVEPESVTFPIKVTPEFPIGNLTGLIALIIASLILMKTLKRVVPFWSRIE